MSRKKITWPISLSEAIAMAGAERDRVKYLMRKGYWRPTSRFGKWWACYENEVEALKREVGVDRRKVEA